jgi:hypothetical protein
MDPYLERRGLWEGVHTRLIVAIPDLPIPLRQGEAEPILPLNQVLHDLYDRAGYDLAIDYSRPAVPPLREEDAPWAAQMIDQLNKEPIG